tara:strand:- start:1406 stop:1681 length:276 start_codon:yes stop_codon:yes gene_type:complete
MTLVNTKNKCGGETFKIHSSECRAINNGRSKGRFFILSKNINTSQDVLTALDDYCLFVEQQYETGCSKNEAEQNALKAVHVCKCAKGLIKF